jgi:1-acyl-sn-glycerol-3-phosphate acyltransferase
LLLKEELFRGAGEKRDRIAMLAGPDEQESATIKKAATNQGHGSSRVQKLALHFCAGVVRLLMRPIARIEIPDLAVQPQAGEGLIIAANHRSMLDMFVGLITFSKWKLYPHMLVRGDLCHLPIIGWLLRKLGAIPAGRGHSSVRHAKSLLNQGRVLVLTPEGRIVSQEERIRGVGELKPGIGYLSAAHGTPILLVLTKILITGLLTQLCGIISTWTERTRGGFPGGRWKTPGCLQ